MEDPPCIVAAGRLATAGCAAGTAHAAAVFSLLGVGKASMVAASCRAPSNGATSRSWRPPALMWVENELYMVLAILSPFFPSSHYVSGAGVSGRLSSERKL